MNARALSANVHALALAAGLEDGHMMHIRRDAANDVCPLLLSLRSVFDVHSLVYDQGRRGNRQVPPESPERNVHAQQALLKGRHEHGLDPRAVAGDRAAARDGRATGLSHALRLQLYHSRYPQAQLELPDFDADYIKLLVFRSAREEHDASEPAKPDRAPMLSKDKNKKAEKIEIPEDVVEEWKVKQPHVRGTLSMYSRLRARAHRSRTRSSPSASSRSTPFGTSCSAAS
jgi:hypothetical protein